MPVCEHGIEIPQVDCSIHASHHTHRDLAPEQVIADYIKTIQDCTHRCKATMPTLLNVAYGPTAKQKIDYYGGGHDGCPIVAFVHGGLWVEGSLNDATVFVERFAAHGCTVAAIGYDLIGPGVSLKDIVAQITSALSSIASVASTRKSCGIILCGHSAGAHLAAMALVRSDVTVVGRVRAACLFSGIYDLAGAVQRDMGDVLGLTPENIAELSPIAHTFIFATTCRHIPLHLFIGDSEGAWYKSQTDTFYKRLMEFAPKVKVTLHEVKDSDHFTIMLKFAARKKEYEAADVILDCIGVRKNCK